MVSLIIFLILVFILYELYFFNIEKFSSHNKYDRFFDGDLLMYGENNTPVNIGVGKEPNSDYLIDVNGKLTIKGNLRVGSSILNYNLAKKINKLPLYSRDTYCLYESDGQTKQCINENQLGMITGHNKVMFQNRYGQVLSNLRLKHHGNHHSSQGGRKFTNKNPWWEGFIYRDLETSTKTHENDIWKRQTNTYRDYHDSLENSNNATPNDNNQFKILPVFKEDTRINHNDPDTLNVILGHIGSGQMFMTFGIGTLTTYWSRYKPYVEKVISDITGSTNHLKKGNDEDATDAKQYHYIKLQKIKDTNEYYIRVKTSENLTTGDGTWGYLRSTNNNHLIRNPVNARIVDTYPSGVNRFKIEGIDGPFDKSKQMQKVKIVAQNGRKLSFGRWDDHRYSLFGMRFLRGGKDYDYTWNVYIDVGSAVGEQEVFTPRKPYKCVE
jgi:hypothetical protein